MHDIGDRKEPLPWTAVRQVAVDLLGALGHAHASGLLHRDLKPANVLLCPAAREGERHRVVLTDFGFAGASAEESEIRHPASDARASSHRALCADTGTGGVVRPSTLTVVARSGWGSALRRKMCSAPSVTERRTR